MATRQRPVQGHDVAVGYIRVSTDSQPGLGQRHDVLAYANNEDLKVERLLEFQASTRRGQKERGLVELRDHIQQHGPRTIVATELSRLGRSTFEVLALVEEFTKERGCRIVALKERLALSQGETDMMATAMLTLCSLFAEMERSLISERTKAALAAAKARGVKLGRPAGQSKLDRHKKFIMEALAMGVMQKAIAKRLGVGRNTVGRWVDRHWKEIEIYVNAAEKKDLFA